MSRNDKPGKKSPKTVLSRRSLLAAGGGALAVTAVAGTGSQAFAADGVKIKATRPPTPTDEKPTAKKTPLSANGWATEAKANDGGTIWSRSVNGTGFSVDLRTGDVGATLLYVVRRFHYEIDALKPGEVTGFKALGNTSRTSPVSNHASGTAVSIRPGFYPDGSSGGFFPFQLDVIRDILAECGGTVRWGGDDDTPRESLFYIDVPPDDEDMSTVGGRIRGWNERHGQGAGPLVDPLTPKRRAAAVKLQRAQRKG